MQSWKVVAQIPTIAATIAATGVSTIEPWQAEANFAAVVSAGAALIGTIVVIVSLRFLKHQLKLQTEQLKLQTDQLKQQEKLIRNANSQALVDISSPFNMALITDKDVARLWFESARTDTGFTPLDQERIKNISIWWFVFYENIYLQGVEKLLDDAIAYGWNQDLMRFIERPLVRKYWGCVREVYHKDFMTYVDKLIADYEATLNTTSPPSSPPSSTPSSLPSSPPSSPSSSSPSSPP